LGWGCTLRSDPPKIVDADFEVIGEERRPRPLVGHVRPKLAPYSTEGRWSNEDIQKTIRWFWLIPMLFGLVVTVIACLNGTLVDKPKPDSVRILPPGADGYCPPDAICPQPVPSKP
jgi:hypothetical protein